MLFSAESNDGLILPVLQMLAQLHRDVDALHYNLLSCITLDFKDLAIMFVICHKTGHFSHSPS